MRSFVISMMMIFVASSAFAYKDGTYNCKNIAGLPDNVYTVKTVDFDGVAVAHVDMRRYIRESNGKDINPTVREIRVSGFATTASSRAGYETLSLGVLRFEFEGDNLLNCRK